MSIGLHPIFAPITYGDERQVCRTRRGPHCEDEITYLDPATVYLHCFLCEYDWTMTKQQYVTGEGPPEGILVREPYYWEKNRGTGGTGYIEQIDKDLYNVYDTRPGDCCKGYAKLCEESEDGTIHIADFYPLIIPIEEYPSELITDNGEILVEYDSDHNPIIPPEYFGEKEEIYRNCSNSEIFDLTKKWFGGHPLICPNCCKINFKAHWREVNDNPHLEEKGPICNDIIVIDVQKVKSHLI
jgi:hypothetical protein